MHSIQLYKYILPGNYPQILANNIYSVIQLAPKPIIQPYSKQYAYPSPY